MLRIAQLPTGTGVRCRTSRIDIVRTIDGARQEIRAGLTDIIRPGDTVVVPERYF